MLNVTIVIPGRRLAAAEHYPCTLRQGAPLTDRSSLCRSELDLPEEGNDQTKLSVLTRSQSQIELTVEQGLPTAKAWCAVGWWNGYDSMSAPAQCALPVYGCCGYNSRISLVKGQEFLKCQANTTSIFPYFPGSNNLRCAGQVNCFKAPPLSGGLQKVAHIVVSNDFINFIESLYVHLVILAPPVDLR